MADARRLDLIYRNINHVVVFSEREMFLSLKDDMEAKLKESVNLAVIVNREGLPEELEVPKTCFKIIFIGTGYYKVLVFIDVVN